MARRKIFKNIKSRAHSFEMLNEDIQAYLKDQDKYSQREFELSSFDQLNLAVNESQIIFLGDFHTFDQNIRNVLRILKIIIKDRSNCVIGLEMIHSDKQLYIDAYMDKQLTDLEFLESIDYHDSWRFPWSHYKLIFELAKELGMDCFS